MSDEKGFIGNLAPAQREKYWDELTDAEKIERMRDEIHVRDYALDQLMEAMERMIRHSHDSQGRLVEEIQFANEAKYSPFSRRFGQHVSTRLLRAGELEKVRF